MKKIIIGLFLMLCLSYLGLCYYFASRVIIPPQRALEDPTELVAKYGPKTDVVLRTADGLQLHGWMFENKDSTSCGVILVHGHGSNRYGMRYWMPYYWMKGCDIFMYDHRAHGESEGAYGTFGIFESKDLMVAHDHFRSVTGLRDDQIGWVGASWGAATALQAGPEVGDLSFILADSPYKDLNAAVMERAIRDYGGWIRLLKPTIYALVKWRAGFDPEQASTLEKARDIEVPVLLIHSRTDEATSSDQSEAIAEVINPDLLVFHHTDWGSLHTRDVREHPERYWQLIDDFMMSQGIDLF